ncbi:hypothetical protein EVAR_53608_1 [Eumeta japonica]|uniref:Uncharacterized protein n=1 Tax=Eumeta variegata TaxID=151549 RepID=A0A4C1X2J2_EUMVA|nr:hypothetical protein EVAR_53608_1 [Eumeta japonica]
MKHQIRVVLLARVRDSNTTTLFEKSLLSMPVPWPGPPAAANTHCTTELVATAPPPLRPRRSAACEGIVTLKKNINILSKLRERRGLVCDDYKFESIISRLNRHYKEADNVFASAYTYNEIYLVRDKSSGNGTRLNKYLFSVTADTTDESLGDVFQMRKGASELKSREITARKRLTMPS